MLNVFRAPRPKDSDLFNAKTSTLDQSALDFKMTYTTEKPTPFVPKFKANSSTHSNFSFCPNQFTVNTDWKTEELPPSFLLTQFGTKLKRVKKTALKKTVNNLHRSAEEIKSAMQGNNLFYDKEPIIPTIKEPEEERPSILKPKSTKLAKKPKITTQTKPLSVFGCEIKPQSSRSFGRKVVNNEANTFNPITPRIGKVKPSELESKQVEVRGVTDCVGFVQELRKQG